MGLLGKILGKLGIDATPDATPDAHRSDPRFSGVKSTSSSAATGRVDTTPPVSTMAEVDVMSKLEQKASLKPQKLNWRTSIVDLLTLLDLDSSLAARKELADELGAPSHLKDGSAEKNMWLHRQVMQRIAANGGNVPRELLG